MYYSLYVRCLCAIETFERELSIHLFPFTAILFETKLELNHDKKLFYKK